MARIRWNGEELLRYGMGIACLILCFLVEWRMLDRLTGAAYEVRYQAELEKYRQDPQTYLEHTPMREEYQSWFREQYARILTDIRCLPIEKSYLQEVAYEDSWYGERTYGGERRHEGTDLMSRSGVSGEIPVVSMTDGVVKNMGWLQLGGWRIGIESENGIYYYYAHLQSYAAGLEAGDTVCAGQLLGFMGDSGYGEKGTTGMFAVHLHLGIYLCGADGQEISVNPYPFLRELEENP